MKIAFSIPGFPNIDSVLPPGVPKGGFGTLNNIIATLVVFALVAGVFYCLYVIAHGAFNIIMSGGDKEKLVEGRERLRYAIIGLLLIFFSFFIISIIETFFGINLMKPTSYPMPVIREIGGSCTKGSECVNNSCINFVCANPCADNDKDDFTVDAGSCTDWSGTSADFCIGSSVRQFKCSTSNLCASSSITDCAAVGLICHSGACVIPCGEIDNGDLTTIAGSCTDSKGSFADECIGPNTVIQYTCDASTNSCKSIGGASCAVGMTCVGGKCQ